MNFSGPPGSEKSVWSLTKNGGRLPSPSARRPRLGFLFAQT